MSAPQIHNRFRTIPASLLLSTLGRSLDAIKDEDGANDADLGAVLGKHEDTAGRYRAATAEMGVVSFLRGCREWDGRFANATLALVGMKLTPIEAGGDCDRVALSALCALLAKKSHALENDGVIDDAELEDMWPELEAAAKHIDRLRHRRSVKLLANG